jgi:hypothetical protein
MTARHTEEKRRAFSRMHVAAIKKLVFEGLTLAGDSKIRQFPEQWRIGYEIGQKHLADDIRAILGAPPKGYSEIEPTLKTKAKNRYLDWREMQAKGEWKKLSDAEQERWEEYVENNVPFEVIREKELERASGTAKTVSHVLPVGTRVELLWDVEFVGEGYPQGAQGVITDNAYAFGYPYTVEFYDGKLGRQQFRPDELKVIA